MSGTFYTPPQIDPEQVWYGPMTKNATWHIRSFGSWYLRTHRESSKSPGKIVARVWRDDGGYWMWSAGERVSRRRIKNINQAKRSAARAAGIK